MEERKEVIASMELYTIVFAFPFFPNLAFNLFTVSEEKCQVTLY
jgi:hypothetical protein